MGGGGAPVAEWSKALQLREKINQNQKIPGLPPPPPRPGQPLEEENFMPDPAPLVPILFNLPQAQFLNYQLNSQIQMPKPSAIIT